MPAELACGGLANSPAAKRPTLLSGYSVSAGLSLRARELAAAPGGFLVGIWAPTSSRHLWSLVLSSSALAGLVLARSVFWRRRCEVVEFDALSSKNSTSFQSPARMRRGAARRGHASSGGSAKRAHRGGLRRFALTGARGFGRKGFRAEAAFYSGLPTLGSWASSPC